MQRERAAAVISKAAAAHHQFIQQQPAGNQPIGSLMKYQLSGAQISHSARSHLSDARVRQQPFSTRSTPIITPSWCYSGERKIFFDAAIAAI